MRVKITVNTPKNQAEVCIKSQKKAFLGFRGSRRVVKEGVISHNQFYWLLDIKPKEFVTVTKHAARGEVIIRKFYKMLFKVIGRVNKLNQKWKKGAKWLKKQLIKRLNKLTKDSPDDNKDFLGNIEGMTDEELGTFIEIHDKEAVQKLLEGELIIVEEVEE